MSERISRVKRAVHTRLVLTFAHNPKERRTKIRLNINFQKHVQELETMISLDPGKSGGLKLCVAPQYSDAWLSGSYRIDPCIAKLGIR